MKSRSASGRDSPQYQDGESVVYYNHCDERPVRQPPPMPGDVKGRSLRGCTASRPGERKASASAMFGMCAILLNELFHAQEILESNSGRPADVGVDHYKELYNEGTIESARWTFCIRATRRACPTPPMPRDAPCVLVAASDYLRPCPNFDSNMDAAALASLAPMASAQSKPRLLAYF